MTDGILGMARDELIPWPGLNPRTHFDEDALEELRASLKADGMIQPVGVRVNDEPPHWIWAGERRWRASEGILERVPVIVRNISEAVALRLALTENMARNDLSPMEEARGMSRYLEASGDTQKKLAEDLGRTPSWVSNRLRLLKLPEKAQRALEEGALSTTQARDLVLPFMSLREDVQERVTEAMNKIRWGITPLSDHDAREKVRRAMLPISRHVDHVEWSVDEGPYQQQRLEASEIPNDIKVTWSGWATWRQESATRVFDVEWWEARMAELVAEQEAEAEAAAELDDQEEEDAPEWPEEGPLDMSAGRHLHWWMYPLVGPAQSWERGIYRGSDDEPLGWCAHVDLTLVDMDDVREALWHDGRVVPVLPTEAHYEKLREQQEERLARTTAQLLQDAYVNMLDKHQHELPPLGASVDELLALLAMTGFDQLYRELRGLGYITDGRPALNPWDSRERAKYLPWIKSLELDPVSTLQVIRVALFRVSQGQDPWMHDTAMKLARATLAEQVDTFAREHWPELVASYENPEEEADDDGDL